VGGERVAVGKERVSRGSKGVEVPFSSGEKGKRRNEKRREFPKRFISESYFGGNPRSKERKRNRGKGSFFQGG